MTFISLLRITFDIDFDTYNTTADHDVVLQRESSMYINVCMFCITINNECLV